MAGWCSSVQWRCCACSQHWVTPPPTPALQYPAPRTLTVTLPMTSADFSNELIGHKREERG